ncbi:MAG: hypothetical protein PWQ82_1722 [Thermosediminibacterales bacterium]|nr:hypothetical protein [Thermosediminibacterales bacterium]MDK2836238.1 hypothetical protein [Thermosediminibacterales bacterium]
MNAMSPNTLEIYDVHSPQNENDPAAYIPARPLKFIRSI